MKKGPSTTLMNNLWSMITHETKEKNIFRFISALKKKKKSELYQTSACILKTVWVLCVPRHACQRTKLLNLIITHYTCVKHLGLYLVQTASDKNKMLCLNYCRSNFLRFIDIFWKRLMHSIACGGWFNTYFKTKFKYPFG